MGQALKTINKVAHDKQTQDKELQGTAWEGGFEKQALESRKAQLLLDPALAPARDRILLQYEILPQHKRHLE